MFNINQCRVSYFRDQQDNRRVLTIVRKFEPKEGVLQFGFSINKPAEWHLQFQSKRFVTFKKETGDVFSKKEGKRLALKHLNETPIVLEVPFGKRPIRMALEYLIGEYFDQSSGSVAQQAIDHFDHKYKQEKVLGFIPGLVLIRPEEKMKVSTKLSTRHDLKSKL